MRKTQLSSRMKWLFSMAALSLTSFAQAATLHVSATGTDAGNCTNMAAPCGSIAYAISQASDGDEIVLANGTYNMTSTVVVNKDITIRGESEAGVILTGGFLPSQYFFLFSGGGAGATLTDVTVVKTDKTGPQNLIGVQANNVTVSNSTFQGQYVLGDGDVSRAIEVSPGVNGFTFSGNTVSGLRQPAYLNPNSTGTITDNTVSGTRGFVVDNGNYTFTDNHFSGNAVDIAILASTNAAWYTDLKALSEANNNAVINDQRTGTTCAAPEFTACPGNQSATAAPFACSAVVTYNASATANADAPDVSYTFTGATTGSGTGTGSGSTFNAGVTNVTISATNDCGTVTCSFTVTVSKMPCTITVTPANTTYTGGTPTNIYLGYGPQSATITVTPDPNATGYSWSGPAGPLSGTGNSRVFTPTAPGTYTYTVTSTNSNGCTHSCTVTFCVKDVRVPGGKGKVYVCHNGNTLSISSNAVPAHLGNHEGDALGYCGQTCDNQMSRSVAGKVLEEEIRVFPNPSNGSFTVSLPYVDESAQITVSDMQGRLISTKTVTDQTQVEFRLGQVAPGMYFVQVINGGVTMQTKMIIE